MNSPSSPPPKKKLFLSLDRQRRQDSSKRFSVVSEEDFVLGCQGVVPANTKSSNEWAMRNLKEWMDSRSSSEESVPEDLLSCSDSTVVCKWLCRFVQETRKVDGTRYPPSTIRSLLSAFQRVMRDNKLPYRLFDSADLRFLDLRKTLDTVCVSLRKEGIGRKSKPCCCYFSRR